MLLKSQFFDKSRAKNATQLIGLIVADIRKKRKAIVLLKANQSDSNVTNIEMKRLKKEIMYHLSELENVGCFLRDFHTGEIHFPAIGVLGGIWSWLPDEDSLSYLSPVQILNNEMQIKDNDGFGFSIKKTTPFRKI